MRRTLVAGLLLLGGLSGCNITGTDVTQERADDLDACLRKAGFTIRDVGVDHRGLDADDQDYNTVSATTRGGTELTAYAFPSAEDARRGYPRIVFFEQVRKEDPLVGPFVVDFEPGATAGETAAAVRCARRRG